MAVIAALCFLGLRFDALDEVLVAEGLVERGEFITANDLSFLGRIEKTVEYFAELGASVSASCRSMDHMAAAALEKMSGSVRAVYLTLGQSCLV